MKIDDLELNSLSSNQVWNDTYNIFQNNKEQFEELIEHIHIKYKIDTKTSRDSILFEIMSCQYNNELYKSKVGIKWILTYIIILFGVLLSGAVSFFITLFRKKQKLDLVYEEMWSKNSLCHRFYNYIDNQLGKNIKNGVLLNTISVSTDFFIKPIQSWTAKIINRKYSNIIFDFPLSCKVFFNDLIFVSKLYRMSKNKDINYVYIYLRFLRKFLTHTSQSSGITSSVLVSAGDYYWNPIKYFVYKKTVKHIILLQHNHVNEYLHLRMFQYCDDYYAHSNQSIEKHELCGPAKFYSVGSFQLIPFLNRNTIKYDVVFISQTVYDNLKAIWPDLDQEGLINSYKILINNFYVYLKNNPNINAAYVCKLGYENSETVTTDKTVLQSLKNIEYFSTAGKDTYEVVSKAKLVINMYSSVGYEAYGLNKRVLWINYNKCCDIFKYDTEKEDLHVLINNTSYETFKERINLLLSENMEVDGHYMKLKEKYMNIQENPAAVVARKINELVGTEDKHEC